MAISRPASVVTMLSLVLAATAYSVPTTPHAAAADAAAAAAASHDYACVAAGRVFVARNWLPAELTRDLRDDLKSLLSDGSVPDTDEPIGKRLKIEFDTSDWSVEGEEDGPSPARAEARRRLDALRAELEVVAGRRLYLDELGAQAKYSVGKLNEPIALHLDARHEAFAGRFYDQEQTRRSLAWLLYLSEDDWGEDGGSGGGGALRAYPRRDACEVRARCGAHEGNLQVGWLERGRISVV